MDCCGEDGGWKGDAKFEFKRVADGVHVAVAQPAYKVNCNTAIVEDDDGVMVVDTHSKPTAARVIVEHLRGMTTKPVRYVVNTHFHWDHWQGNEVYASANPGLEIITTEQTKQNLTTPDVGVGGVPFIEKQLAALPGEIAKLKDDIQKAPNAEVKGRLQSNLAQAEAYLQELKQIKPALPTRTVSKTVTLQEGGREIQLHVLGRGHTNGDLYIYMPKEKVVATGDAVVDWMPFLNDGYPEEWAQTVAALEKLDIVQIIPGHGEPAPKAHLAFFRGYLTDLVAAVKTAAAGGATLDEMKTKVADQLAPKYEKGMSRYPVGQFRDRIDLNVEMVHKKVVAKS